jgi:hypothetical protein
MSMSDASLAEGAGVTEVAFHAPRASSCTKRRCRGCSVRAAGA